MDKELIVIVTLGHKIQPITLCAKNAAEKNPRELEVFFKCCENSGINILALSVLVYCYYRLFQKQEQ